MVYDILIKNGLIYDGTGKPPFKGDVLVNGERIVEVGGTYDPSCARKVIDAKEMVVSPGLIDPHTHSDYEVIHNRQMTGTITQGVTTVIVGMCGLGILPNKKEYVKDVLKFYSGIVEYNESQTYDWRNVEEYLKRAEGASVNVAAALNHCALRIFADGFNGSPYDEELSKTVNRLISEGMEQGAVGLSTGLDYYPASTNIVKTEELIDMCKTLEKHNGVFFSHVRPAGDIDPMEEMITVAKESGVKLHILHTKTFPGSTMGHPEWITDKFEKANKEGTDITLEFYPYAAWSTLGIYFVPFWAMEGGYEKLIQRLKDTSLRDKLTDEVGRMYDYLMGDDKPAIFGSAKNHPEYEGLTFDEVAKMRNQSMGEMIVDVLYESDLGITALANEPDEKTCKQLEKDWMTLFDAPFYTVASDTINIGKYPHPRGFGSFARMIRLSREYNYPLEEMIYKFTKFNADRFSLKDRGVIEKGKFADIIVFDYNSVNDRATNENPRNTAAGMEWMMVNGKIALQDERPTGLLAGKGLKRE